MTTNTPINHRAALNKRCKSFSTMIIKARSEALDDLKKKKQALFSNTDELKQKQKLPSTQLKAFIKSTKDRLRFIRNVAVVI
jgi:predicted P-loop ATPase